MNDTSTAPVYTDSRTVYKRLLGFVKPYWRVFFVAIGAMVILAATEPAMPALLKPTLDDGFMGKDLNTVALMAFGLVAIFLIRGLAAYASAFAMAWVAGKVVMDLRNAMFEKLLALPSGYFDANASGKLISKITFDANQVTEAASYVITVIVKDSLAIIGLLAWMVYLNWQLSLITFATAPIVVFIVGYFSRRLRKMSHNLQRTMGEVTHAVDEAIAGQKVIRIFGGQSYEQTRFQKTTNWVRRFQLKFASAAAAVAPFAQLVTATAAAIILYSAAHLAIVNEITIGGFASFFLAMGLLFSPIKRLTGVNSRLQKGLAGAESVFALLDHDTERDDGKIELASVRGALEFRNVCFAYDKGGLATLRHINLTLNPGETVALVGASGAGKTSLVNLIPRFYRPTEGQILIDGQDIEDVSLHSLRDNISIVSQDVVLFDDSVRGNIAYGPRAESSDEAVSKAAAAANATEFIKDLPDAMATLIGQNGVRLSGGQRQRIALARAFLKDAPILILDEATSSLDTVAEGQIQSAVESIRKDRTTIVIAHKLSTIKDADKIVVLSDGEIVGTGRHEDLLRSNQIYAALYRFQFSPAGESPSDSNDPQRFSST